MKTGTIKHSGDIAAKIFSLLFHPLLITVYGILIIFSSPALIGYIPITVKKILLIIILINNLLLPLSLIPYFKFRNIISSWFIEKRQERVLPLITTSFFYSVTVYITFRFHIPLLIKSFLITAAFLAIAVTVINFWWKISIHSTGAGAITALIIIMSIKMQIPLVWLLVAVIFTDGSLMSARLWLNAHTPGEVWTGFLLGILSTSLLLYFL